MQLAGERIRVGSDLRALRAQKHEYIEQGSQGYHATIDELGLNQDARDQIKELRQASHKIVIGEIDQDGFIASYFGPVKNASCVSWQQFLGRRHFSLEVVDINGCVGVRKSYKGNRLAFLNETRAMHGLGRAGCNVPAIIDIDFSRLTLTFSYILGCVIREELAKHGALLRDRDVRPNEELMRLTPRERALRRIQEGKRVLYDVVDNEFVEKLFVQIRKAHDDGFVLDDLKYGNIIVEQRSGEPYLIDFENARSLACLKKARFETLRRRDIATFNLLFDTDKPLT